MCADGTGFGEGRSVGSDVWTGGVGRSGVCGIGADFKGRLNLGPSARCSPHVVIVCIEGDGLKCAKSGIEQGSWVRGAPSSEVREGCVNMGEDRGSKVGCEPKSWGMADLGRCRNWCWGGRQGQEGKDAKCWFGICSMVKSQFAGRRSAWVAPISARSFPMMALWEGTFWICVE